MVTRVYDESLMMGLFCEWIVSIRFFYEKNPDGGCKECMLACDELHTSDG